MLSKNIGPCPSFVCTIPLVERAFVQAGIGSPKNNWELTITDPSTFVDSILSTPEFKSWDKDRPQFHSDGFKAGFRAFKAETLWNALMEFQRKWNELHPRFNCEIIGGFARVLNISGRI